MILLDTSAIIQVWERRDVAARAASLDEALTISIFSLIELDGGVYAQSKNGADGSISCSAVSRFYRSIRRSLRPTAESSQIWVSRDDRSSTG